MEGLLTVKELAKLLRLSRQTIYKMLEEGSIPALRMGSQWRFDRDTIEAWLASQASNATVESRDE